MDDRTTQGNERQERFHLCWEIEIEDRSKANRKVMNNKSQRQTLEDVNDNKIRETKRHKITNRQRNMKGGEGQTIRKRHVTLEQ